MAAASMVLQFLRRNKQSLWVGKAAGTWHHEQKFWDVGLTYPDPCPEENLQHRSTGSAQS